jgi:hypothetical protein
MSRHCHPGSAAKGPIAHDPTGRGAGVAIDDIVAVVAEDRIVRRVFSFLGNGIRIEMSRAPA